MALDKALRPLADVRLENELRTVLRLLAARSAGELVVSGIAKDADLARATAANYIGLLQALHLVITLPAWSSNHTTRAKRRSKVVRHARMLASFRDTYGSRFTLGLVIHAGPHTLPLGDRLWAVPVSTLWRTDPAAA